jgi:hypothetical protein
MDLSFTVLKRYKSKCISNNSWVNNSFSSMEPRKSTALKDKMLKIWHTFQTE